MKRYLIPIMIILLAGAASGSVWLNDKPLYLMDTTNFVTPYFKPTNMSPFEVINAPYFGLVGSYLGSVQTASPGQPVSVSSLVTSTSSAVTSTSSASAGTSSASSATMTPVVIKSTPMQTAIPPVDFSGNLENNLQYAGSKSSLRIGQSGSWTTLQTPWLIK